MRDHALFIATRILLLAAWLLAGIGTGLTWLGVRAAARAVRLSRLHSRAWLDKREEARLRRLSENF